MSISSGSSPIRFLRTGKKSNSSVTGSDPNLQVTSFREIPFESDEMKRLLRMSIPDYVERKGPDVKYDSNVLMPDWILANPEWKSTRLESSDNNLISDILQIPFSSRSQEQNTVLAKWLMSVWEIANTMGFKRCVSMSEAMQYSCYDVGQPIVTEGDRGLVFYIIVSGTSNVHKEGIGNVAQLTKGQSFGELALTQGKDLRTASVVALSKTEVLCLHKRDYDHFVRDIQLGERRENFAAIRQCKLFEHWTRNKIERMCNTSRREIFKEGQYVFKQGDPPDNLYLVVEGTLHAVRSVETVVSNRWPDGTNSWHTVSKKHVKSVFVKELIKGDYFGELSIIKNDVRRANVIAKTRCVLLTIDKLDFLHLLRHRNAIKSVLDSAEEYAEVNKTVDNSDETSIGSAGSKNRKLSLKFKTAVSKAVTGTDKRKVSMIRAVRDATQLIRPQTCPSLKGKLTRDGTISRMTKLKTRLVKHDEHETMKLFREQLGNISSNTPRMTPRSLSPHREIEDQQTRAKEVDTSWRKQSAFGQQFPRSISFKGHDEQRPKSAQHVPHQESLSIEECKPVVFSPITDLSTINEEKAKNKCVLHLPQNDSYKPLNVSVTSVLDVNSKGRRQRSVCVKNVKELVTQTRQQWLQEVNTSPSAVSPFRRQSSLGLLQLAEPSPAAGIGGSKSLAFMLQRRQSTIAEAQEDVMKDDQTGELHFKPMKKEPVEFQKGIMGRSKLTFYEVMSEKNPADSVPSHLPILGSHAEEKTSLFSPSSRRGSGMPRPASSPLRPSRM